MDPLVWERGKPVQVLLGDAFVTLNNSSNDPKTGRDVIHIVPLQYWKPFKRPESKQRMQLQIEEVSCKAGIFEQLQPWPLNVIQSVFPHYTGPCIDEASQVLICDWLFVGGARIPFIKISILLNRSGEFEPQPTLLVVSCLDDHQAQTNLAATVLPKIHHGHQGLMQLLHLGLDRIGSY